VLAHVKVLLDSDVLVAALHRDHPHHARATPWLRSERGAETVVAAHSLAQVFRVLTTVSFGRPFSPSEAADALRQDVVERCAVRSLGPRRHMRCIRAISRRGLAGGIVYDALIAEVGRAAKVDKIVTFNVADFRRVAPDLDVVAP
jgi:predicted nucleic acid-binding protein